MTLQEAETRMAEINKREPEELTPEEEASLRAAEAMDDGTSVSLDSFIKEHEEQELKKAEEMKLYSGKISLRIPRSLHKALKEKARAEGVSLNQYMLYKLAQ